MRLLAQGDRTLDSLREYALLETVYRTPVRRSCPSSGRGLAERQPSTGQLTGTSRVKLTPAGKDRLARPTARPGKTPPRVKEPRATPPDTDRTLF
jgi:hypothetical protein